MCRNTVHALTKKGKTMLNPSRLLEDVTVLIKNMSPPQWDRFALWLLGRDGPLANVNPLPSCLVIIRRLYEDRLEGRPHDAAAWKDCSDCLFDVCLGQRWSTSTDQRSRRRKVSGRLAASAGANAAAVYAAFPYNPQRHFSPPRLVLYKVQAITDACTAHAWTAPRGEWKHRRDNAYQIVLEDCLVELERMYSTTHNGVHP